MSAAWAIARETAFPYRLCSALTARRLFFASWASDLASNDFNQWADIFILPLPGSGAFANTNGAPPLEFSGIAPETPGQPFSAGQPLMLIWPSEPGVGYQVQFKNSLTDPQWQPLGAPATVVGSQGAVIDNSPAGPTRFYRLISH